MGDETTTAGGQTDTSGAGDGAGTSTTDSGSAGGGGDESGRSGEDVSYETHRRLLSQKKKLQEERDRLLADKEKRDAEAVLAEKTRLEEQGEYKQLLDLERKKNEELAGQLNTFETTSKQAKKLDAVLTATNGKIPKKFWGLIDLGSVVVDPETGEVDAMSVTKTVENLRAEYPEIIRTGKGGSLPPNAPQGSGQGTLTYDEWKKLPLDEMKKRQAEVMANDRVANA
jgi:hypothetical protein